MREKESMWGKRLEGEKKREGKEKEVGRNEKWKVEEELKRMKNKRRGNAKGKCWESLLWANGIREGREKRDERAKGEEIIGNELWEMKGK